MKYRIGRACFVILILIMLSSFTFLFISVSSFCRCTATLSLLKVVADRGDVMAERERISKYGNIGITDVLVNAGQSLTNGTTCYPIHGDAEPGRSLATCL